MHPFTPSQPKPCSLEIATRGSHGCSRPSDMTGGKDCISAVPSGQAYPGTPGPALWVVGQSDLELGVCVL